MTRDQLIQQINGRTRRVRMMGSNLAGFDFSGLDLSGADLRFSNLTRANFQGTTLVGADLSFSQLNHATFEDADLTDANLSYCGLNRVNLDGAVIEGLHLNFTNLKRTIKRPDGPAEKLTLTTLLQKPGWGLLIGMFLGALLVYGCSGIIYFTAQVLQAREPALAQLNQYIILQNIADGMLVFLLTWSLTNWLGRVFRPAWLRHLVLSGLVTVLFVGFNTLLYFWMGADVVSQLGNAKSYAEDNAPWYAYVAGNVLIGNIIFYVLRQGKQISRKLSEQEFQLLNLEKLKTRAELDALQAKINPHFLYNALNSIASLVHEDPDKAEEMTMLLSKLFRYTTGRNGDYFISLADELEMARTYLQVEQVRFGERLSFRVEVADPVLNALRLPQFILQPIVENSVKHGIAKSAGAGRIDLTIYEKSGWLYLSVHDSGPPFPDTMNAGYGLRSIQDKLKLLYGDDATVEFSNEPYKQVLIAVRLTRLKTPLISQ